MRERRLRDGPEGRTGRRIGPVTVEVASCEDALDRMLGAIAGRASGIWGFCNAHTVNIARRDPEFRKALTHATLFNDGVGVDIASRLLYGVPFAENVNGTDLTPVLLARLPAATPIFLVGSRPGIAKEAAEAIERDYPNVSIAGTQHGFFTRSDEPALAACIAASGAQLVLAGMGHPAQECWAARNTAAIPAPILCIGAFIDRAAGHVTRAPAVLRQLRLEWAYRLALEPRRLAGRYVVGNVAFLLATLRQRSANRGS